jgi:hypothetical protein
MRIERADIIAALLTEPDLYPGLWVAWAPAHRFVTAITAPPKDTPCQVCAVGAVMRRVLPQGATLYDVEAAASNCTWDGSTSQNGDVDTEIRRGRWMNALSIFFESTLGNDTDALGAAARAERVEAARKATVKFVESRFPETIEVNIADRWRG